MVKFTRAVDIAQESLTQSAADSEFEFGEDFFGEVLEVAWKHKSDSEPRKEVRRALLELIRSEASRRGDPDGN